MQRSKLPMVLLAALGAAPLLNGCVAIGAAAGASVNAVTGQDRTFGESYNDTRAANSVRSALNVVDRIAFAHVNVNVQEGKMLLFGTTPTNEHRQTAELVARSTRGVTEVYNEIQVGQNERAMNTMGDEMLATRVHTRLLSSAEVRGVDVDVEAFRGTVYLMGAQRTDQEVRRAAEIASLVNGVDRVVSLMSVRDVRAPVEAVTAFQPQEGPASSERRTASSGY